MSKRNEELIRRQHSFNENPDYVVDRYSRSNFSTLPIIIFFAIILLFNFIFKNKDVIETVIESTSIEETISYTQKQSKSSNAASIHQLVSSGSLADIEQLLPELDGGTINEVVAGMTPIMLAAS